MFGLIDKVYNGTTDVLGGTGGFLTDILRATREGASGDFGEAAETLLGSVEEDLMGGVMGGLFGPEGIGGGIIGALPEGVRAVGREVVNPVFGAWDWTIQEVVDRPLGTMWTMISPGQFKNNPIGLFDPRQYYRAWQINDKRTFGQSFAAAWTGIDPFDEDEYNSIKDDPIFNLISGTADFAQEFIDPVTYVGGAGLKLARGGAVIGKSASGVGRTFAKPSRLGGHLLPRTGELAPTHVMGRGLGYRPSTIAGRQLDGKFSFLTKTDEQRSLRQEIISDWTQARTKAVLDSPEWNRIEDAIEMRPGLGGADRFHIFRQGLGRRGTKLPSETLRLIANGPTREARARTFRILAGDNTVWTDIHNDARMYTEILRHPDGKQAVQNTRMQIDAASKGNPDWVEFTKPEKLQIDALSELADRTDWALFAAFEDSMILSQQKRMDLDFDARYMINSQVEETLKEIPFDVQLAGLEDLLGIADNSLEFTLKPEDLQAQFRYPGVRIKDMPKGKRLAELLARHRDELTTNDFAVAEYINPNVIGGRNSKVRLMSAKITRTHINHTGSSAFNDFEKMLTDASRLKVGDNRAITSAEVGKILGQYQGYLTAGQFSEAANLFQSTNRRIMMWVDDLNLVDAKGAPLDATMRTMTEEYNKQTKTWKDPEKNQILSVTDHAPIKRKDRSGAGSLRHEKDGHGNSTFIHYANSESQLRNSDIIPRYDVVQSHIERSLKRQAGKRGQSVDDMARELGAQLQVVLKNPNDVWRAAVLLTPKWPMRVGLDEQMRLMANLGTLNVVAGWNEAFGRMRRSQVFSRLKHNTGDVADVELLAGGMNKISMRRSGIDTRTELPVDPVYDPVVEELVRSADVKVHYFDELTPEQGAKLDQIKGEHEPPDLEDSVEVEPQNLSADEVAKQEAELEAAKAKGAERRRRRQIRDDLIREDFNKTKQELRRLQDYALPGQKIIPDRMRGETAASYRSRLERELNDRYQRVSGERQQAIRAEEIRTAGEQAPLGASVADREDVYALRQEGIEEALPEGAAVFEMPADMNRQRKRMAEARPEINFLGISFRDRPALPRNQTWELNEKGHMVAPGAYPGETMLNVDYSRTFRLPSRFRPGKRPVDPKRARDWDDLDKRIKSLEQGVPRGVKHKGTLRLPTEGLPEEWADFAGMSMTAINRQRKRNNLPVLDQDEFIDLIEDLTDDRPITSGAEAERADTKVLKRTEVGPADQAAVTRELEDLRAQQRNLGITAEESNEMYRDWIQGRVPEGSSDEYANWILENQTGNPWDVRKEPFAQEVRDALVDGDLNGMTLAVEDMNKTHHGTVLQELQLSLDSRPVVRVAVTGSKSIVNADVIWATLDEIWMENAQHRRLELIVMPDNRKVQLDMLDMGTGVDHIAYEWAKDRGVGVQMRAITDDTRFYEGMDYDYFQQRGVIERVKARDKKSKQGQGKREVDYESLDPQTLGIPVEIWQEYVDYKKELWKDAARKRNNWVLGQADREIVFRHRLVDPETGQEPFDPKVFFAKKAFDDERAINPLREPAHYVDIDENLGYEYLAPTFRYKRSERRTHAEIKASDEARKAARRADEAAAEERAMAAHYEQLAKELDDPSGDRFGEELVRQLDEELVQEFGTDYDPVLLQERLSESNPALDVADEAVPVDEPIDVSSYEVPAAEAAQRQAERDYAEYMAESEPDLLPVDDPVANSAADSRETFFETQYDFEKLYGLVGEEGLKEAVDEIVSERILAGRNLRKLRRDAGVKALIGTGIVFGNPVMGAAWGMMSYMSKRRKIRTAAQQKAALSYSTALRQQARQLLDEVVDPKDRDVARAMMNDAEYLQGLVDAEVRKASKIQNAFDAADELMNEAGFPSLQIGNMSFRSAFGDDSRYVEQIHRQVSANGGMSAVYSGVHKHQKRELERYSKTGWERSSYTDLNVSRAAELVNPKEFAENYDRLINLYTSSSGSKPFNRIAWSNKSIPERVEEMYQLLTNDSELFSRLIDDRGKNSSVWDDIGSDERRMIANNIVMEYENVLPTQYFPELRQRARAGTFTWSDVERRLDTLISEGRVLQGVEVPKYKNTRQEAVRELQEQFDGFGKAIAPQRTVANDGRFASMGKKVNQITEDLFLRYGALPSDELARHPFFKAVYEREMRRTIEPLLDEDGFVNLSQKQIDRIESQARNVGLEETKRVLYELAESSRLAELLGNASPFFNAWQEVTSRWAGFAVDNPMFVGNVGRLYRKPWEAEALGLSQFEDENGNTYVTLRLFGDAFDEDGQQTSIFDVMPQSVKDMVIPPILSDAGQTLRFSKDGINTMMQATPGAGPLVVIPAREAVISNPDLESTLGFLFPFGHPQSKNFVERVLVSNLPTWQKATYDLVTDDTHSREAVTSRMFQDIVLEMQARGEPMDWADEGLWNELQEEAEHRANQFFMFRIGAGLFSPTSTTWESPYQPYMNAYNELEEEHGWRMAQTMFLDRYGEEFYAASATFTRSNDGVSSSVEAERLYEEYQDLVQGEGAPVGDWITGSMGSTAERYRFSQAVHYRQMNMAVAPGSDVMRRERKTGREAISDTMQQLGWRRYTEGRNLVRMHQDRAAAAGMSSSLNASHMQGVAAWWRAYKAELIEDNPVWAEEFNDIHGATRRMNESLGGFIAGLEYEEIRNRPSSRHLIEYLEARMFLQDQLEARSASGGSANLQSGSNADLFDWWEDTKYGFSMRPEFEAIFDRYFERDVVDQATWLDPDDLPPGWFV